MTDYYDNGLIDPWRYAADLGKGYRLAWMYTTDGDRWPIICDTRVPEFAQTVPHGDDLADVAPHEKPGRLPLAYRERIAPRPRCGRPTTATGEPCRVVVAADGDACGYHADQPEPVQVYGTPGDPEPVQDVLPFDQETRR